MKTRLNQFLCANHFSHSLARAVKSWLLWQDHVLLSHIHQLPPLPIPRPDTRPGIEEGIRVATRDTGNVYSVRTLALQSPCFNHTWLIKRRLELHLRLMPIRLFKLRRKFRHQRIISMCTYLQLTIGSSYISAITMHSYLIFQNATYRKQVARLLPEKRNRVLFPTPDGNEELQPVSRALFLSLFALLCHSYVSETEQNVCSSLRTLVNQSVGQSSSRGLPIVPNQATDFACTSC